MTHLDLPEPICAYFDADKRGSEAVASCFTNQGVAPFGVEQKDGRYLVSARVTGNFPGSPVDLRFVFRLERGKIASLEIAP